MLETAGWIAVVVVAVAVVVVVVVVVAVMVFETVVMARLCSLAG